MKRLICSKGYWFRCSFPHLNHLSICSPRYCWEEEWFLSAHTLPKTEREIELPGKSAHTAARLFCTRRILYTDPLSAP